jgi:hypothetical protein
MAKHTSEMQQTIKQKAKTIADGASKPSVSEPPHNAYGSFGGPASTPSVTDQVFSVLQILLCYFAMPSTAPMWTEENSTTVLWNWPRLLTCARIPLTGLKSNFFDLLGRRLSSPEMLQRPLANRASARTLHLRDLTSGPQS